MDMKAKNSVKLISLGLLIYFMVKIFSAINKLQDQKTAVSTTTKYADKRLHPSISVCFPKKSIVNLERASNTSRQVQFSSVPTKQDSGDSDGNRILQDQKQKLLQDSGAPDYHFY